MTSITTNWPSVSVLKEPWHLKSKHLFLLWMSALKTFPNFVLRHIFSQSCAGLYLKGCSQVICTLVWASSMKSSSKSDAVKGNVHPKSEAFCPPVGGGKCWTTEVCFMYDISWDLYCTCGRSFWALGPTRDAAWFRVLQKGLWTILQASLKVMMHIKICSFKC